MDVEAFIKHRKIACGYLALRCWCPHMHHLTCSSFGNLIQEGVANYGYAPPYDRTIGEYINEYACPQ